MRLLYHLAIIAPLVLLMGAGAAAGAPGPATAAAALLTVHLLIFRRLALCRLLERHLLLDQACPACGYLIPLNNWWRCPCGFTGFPGRHLLARCRNCRKEFSWLVCPRCEVQIPL